MRDWWKYILAWFRWSDSAVCEMSNRGHGQDFHDYPDADIDGEPAPPMHFHTYTCRRCGKEFGI